MQSVQVFLIKGWTGIEPWAAWHTCTANTMQVGWPQARQLVRGNNLRTSKARGGVATSKLGVISPRRSQVALISLF